MSGAELCERQFQSTPPARGRLEKILLRLKKTAISIHAPREGGRPPQALPIVVPLDFNPRPREGGRHGGAGRRCGDQRISIHAPARGGDAVSLPWAITSRISIHAPARGGDIIANPLINRSIISIHAPARGGDRPACSRFPPSDHFNPRPREGGRRTMLDRDDELSAISIHAPARGGDIWQATRHRYGRYFNPRPREGGRPIARRDKQIEDIFQSTPPRGGATPLTTGSLIAVSRISIHAPARGGDRSV